MSFEHFSFHPSVVAGISSTGYLSPTPIQEQAMPAVLAGRDVMGLAQTGTGKTAAFLLPILDRLLKNPSRRRGVRALIVAPTRELAEQISEAARELGRHARLRTATVYGGVAFGPQARKLREGAELVVGCPGRLLDHVGQGTIDLKGVEVLVLDEADHMFDMGFFPDIKKILAELPTERQTLLFSATMPHSVRGLAAQALRDPETVRIGRQAPPETVAQAVYPVPAGLKTPLLLALLGQAETGSVLVFTRTKHRAKRLAACLEQAGHRAASLQGNLSQNQRRAALDGFRDGRFKVLVATDIAARGIDVTRVAHVINYDIPDTPEAYTHRIGRTGRAERTGEAHSLITGEDASLVRAIEALLGRALPRRVLDDFDYTAKPVYREEAPSRPRPGRTPSDRTGDRARGRSGRWSGPARARAM